MPPTIYSSFLFFLCIYYTSPLIPPFIVLFIFQFIHHPTPSPINFHRPCTTFITFISPPTTISIYACTTTHNICYPWMHHHMYHWHRQYIYCCRSISDVSIISAPPISFTTSPLMYPPMLICIFFVAPPPLSLSGIKESCMESCIVTPLNIPVTY